MGPMNVINLTTGLEWLPIIGEPDAYCRLQSTHLEGGHWQRFLDSVDEGILYALARGDVVRIFDCGSRRPDGKSRVLWQGLPLIRWHAARAFGIRSPERERFPNGHNPESWFRSLDLDTSRLAYYRRHCVTDQVHLYGFGHPSRMDGRGPITRETVLCLART